jgi:hypothetical protein
MRTSPEYVNGEDDDRFYKKKKKIFSTTKGRTVTIG